MSGEGGRRAPERNMPQRRWWGRGWRGRGGAVSGIIGGKGERERKSMLALSAVGGGGRLSYQYSADTQ